MFEKLRQKIRRNNAVKTKAKRYLTTEERLEARDLFNEGVSYSEISRTFDCADTTIMRLIKKWEIEKGGTVLQQLRDEIKGKELQLESEIKKQEMEYRLEELKFKKLELIEDYVDMTGEQDEEESDIDKYFKMIMMKNFFPQMDTTQGVNGGGVPTQTQTETPVSEGTPPPLTPDDVKKYAGMLEQWDKKTYKHIQQGSINLEQCKEKASMLPVDLTDKDIEQIYNHITGRFV